MRSFAPTIIAAICIMSTSCALAESAAVVGQYVISSWRPEKLIERNLEAATGEEFGVVDSTPAAKLVQLGGGELIRGTRDEVFEPSDEAPCLALRRLTREQRLANLLSGSNTPVRRFECVPNGEVTISGFPNDAFAAQQWALNNAPNGAGIADAHDRTKGSGVIIAVIDTGIQLNHPDLASNIWVNPGEIPGDGVDNDGNGYVDDVNGFNFITDTGGSAATDDQGHGTHVAGTIGARVNNGIGVAGINDRISMISLKFLGSNGRGNTWDAYEAVLYVNRLVQRGVPVLLSNNSWGGGPYMSAMQTAINEAAALGVLFVAAAGNEGRNNDSGAYYPANYTGGNMITVASINSAAAKSSFSSYGANSVHIGAPGDGIASTYLNGSYASLSGTSMATPHVAGALALGRAYNRSASIDLLRSTLFSSGVLIPALAGLTITGKTINIPAFLDGLGADSSPPATTPTPAPSTTPTPSPTPTPPSAPTPPTPVPTATLTPTPTPAVIGNFKVVISNFSSDRLEGVRVVYVARTNDGGVHSYVGVTNELGVVEFKDVWVQAVNLSITAEKTGYQFSPYTANFIARNASVTIQGATVSYSLTAKVLDRLGAALSGVVVNCAGCTSNTTSVSNSSGLVSFNALHGAEVTIAAQRPSGKRLLNNNLSFTTLGSSERVLIVY